MNRCSSILLLLLISNIVSAKGISFQPRMETGMMYYAFESEGYSHVQLSSPVPFNTGYNRSESSFEFADIIPFVGVGGTIFYNRWFVDIGGKYAYGGSNTAHVSTSGYTPLGYDADNHYIETAFTSWEQYQSADFDRREMAISLGYSLAPNSSIFAGYKWAETQFDVRQQGQFTMRGYLSDPDSDIQTGHDVWGSAHFGFKYEGPFVGAVQGWRFNRYRYLKGVLIGHLTLAYLKSPDRPTTPKPSPSFSSSFV